MLPHLGSGLSKGEHSGSRAQSRAPGFAIYLTTCPLA
jgi:hypothetical protein